MWIGCLPQDDKSLVGIDAVFTREGHLNTSQLKYHNSIS